MTGNETTSPPEQMPAEPSDAVDGMRASTSYLRIAAALLCLLLAAALSLVVANALAKNQRSDARGDFRQSASAIQSNLAKAIQNEENLTTAAGTFFAGTPKTSPAQFVTWAGWSQVLQRYPELRRLSLLSAVKSSQMRSFAARIGVAKPASSSTARQSKAIKVIPAGKRPEYCLAAAELVSAAVRRAPAGIDYCAREHRLLASRGSGTSIHRALPGSPGRVEVQVPVYRGLVPPSSAAARNAAFVGWVRKVLSLDTMAQQALPGHPGYAISLHYGQGSTGTASARTWPASAQTAQAALPADFGLTVFGPAAAASLLANGRIWVLLAGILIGGLLGLIVLLRRPEQGQTPAAAAPTPAPEPVIERVEPLYDELTGLPNKALTLDRVGLILARAGRQSSLIAGTLLVDVDWFKDVNDKLGREAGDQLLKIVAQRLHGVMRSEDTVGRIGDDRFAVVVECTARSVRLDALAQRVLEALHQPIELDGFGPSFSMTASIGVAIGRYDSPEELLRDAGAALASAKADGKARYKLFDAKSRSVVEGRGVLEADLSAAVQQQGLGLLYEPAYDLESRNVVGLEAKPCWQHPEHGLMGADDLLQLAEDCGLTVPIDRWMLEEACNRAAAWEVEGRRIGVSVKLGATQLHRDGLLTDVRRALQQSGVQPGLLTLEIAESAVMSELSASATRLEEIKRLGVRLAINDFGDSGYAYHSDLRRLPLDCLRVDRSALAASDDPEYRNWLFEAILMVGKELSLTVLATGLHSQEQLDEVQTMGCKVAQGPVLGEAVTADAVAALREAKVPTTLALVGAHAPQPS